MVDVPINVSTWLANIVVNVLLDPLFTIIDVIVLVNIYLNRYDCTGKYI